MPPFPLTAALLSKLCAWQGQHIWQSLLDSTCNHNKVCLNNVTSRLGLSLPQRCTAASAGNLSSEVCTMGSQQLWKSCCNPATNVPQLCPWPYYHIMSLTMVSLSQPCVMLATPWPPMAVLSVPSSLLIPNPFISCLLEDGLITVVYNDSSSTSPHVLPLCSFLHTPVTSHQIPSCLPLLKIITNR